MNKPLAELMQNVMFSAVLETVTAMKQSVNNAPNMLLRDINSIHANSTFEDLPKPVQDAIKDSARNAMLSFRKEGYSITTSTPPTPTRHSGAPKRYPNRRESERQR